MLLVMLLAGCESKPLELMPAVKQFKTDEEKTLHIADMRSHHMHRLMHKRDETMRRGIRTKKHSLNACIDCHVPAPSEQKVVKHTDSEHFCATCHIEVAVKLDCFQCHADRPAVATAEVVKP